MTASHIAEHCIPLFSMAFSRWGVGKAKTFDLALQDFSSSQKSQATKLPQYMQILVQLPLLRIDC
jgi:hypothetical protein